jgi:hypothetical protein
MYRIPSRFILFCLQQINFPGLLSSLLLPAATMGGMKVISMQLWILQNVIWSKAGRFIPPGKESGV